MQKGYYLHSGNSYNHNREKYAVLNSDDNVTEEYMRSTAATVVTYGIDTTSDIMAKISL